jgi:hypothetical protein
MNHIPLNDFFQDAPPKRVLRLRASPEFSPLDFNLQFLERSGWSVTSDRFRFHPQQDPPPDDANELVRLIASRPPHILIRRLNKEEDYFVAFSIFLDGTIEGLSNDSDVLTHFLRGIFTEFPPSFKELSDFVLQPEVVTDQGVIGMFSGMLHGAYGWDPTHDLPPSLEESLKEARTSLAIGNYRSCVVMCRRALEGLLKFAHERLLGTKPIKNNGKSMMLNDLIVVFRNGKTIPDHLLHASDSLRTLGNVPGAHAADIKNYNFTKYDAEFALSTLLYFTEQYFTKVDTDVRTYYTLTIETEEAQQAVPSDGDKPSN